MPFFENALKIRSARIWHCGYKSLAPISQLSNLEVLVVATWPDITFSPLASLKNLKYLQVIHFPHAKDLSPIGELDLLATLSLESLPSWDASGKTLTVNSLSPISKLPNLKHLELFGVRTAEKTLPQEMASRNLVSARFSKYSKSEVQQFYASTGVSDAFAPAPTFEAT